MDAHVAEEAREGERTMTLGKQIAPHCGSRGAANSTPSTAMPSRATGRNGVGPRVVCVARWYFAGCLKGVHVLPALAEVSAKVAARSPGLVARTSAVGSRWRP